ncbi:hypothetical protein M408DRAFT_334097, partial [Serendipita vermifera MAFF 305830]
MESDTTSHLRPSILTSFLSRGSRPRSTATSPIAAESPGVGGTPQGGVAIGNGSNNVLHSSNRRRNGVTVVPNGVTAAASPPTAFPAGSLPIMPGPTSTSFSQMLRRRRSNNGNLNQAASGNAAAAPAMPSSGHGAHSGGGQGAGNASANASASNGATGHGPPHRIRLVPHLENQRALHFDPITRECREGAPAIRIGRFTDRSGTLAASTNSLTGKIAFKSKVVSRGHAELWCEPNAKFYVKDTSSSSGTFLNHMRLSQAGVESRPFLLKDGDILQLGVDYQGGTEEIYRCVKIRVEIGREWQAGPNPFNTQALAQLKSLSNLPTSVSAPAGTATAATRSKSKKTTVSDCCICLFPVTVCQALFIAPCSHSFHYKCIRGTLYEHHPGFSCPLCRSFHDLEADVEVDMPEEEEEWEELPEPENTPGPAGIEAAEVDGGADGDGELEASAAAQADATGMDLSDGNQNSNPARRSMDDEEDIPHGFRTAAEDNDRRTLLPHAHLAAMSPTTAIGSPATRRPPRRGQTMVTPITNQAPFAEEIDRGFDTDGGALGGYGAETDMDIDEPTRGGHYRQHSHGNGNGRNTSASARGRSTIYNLVHSSTGHGASSVNEHGSLNGHGGHQLHHTYAGSAG